MVSLTANSAIAGGIVINKSETFETIDESTRIKYFIGAMAVVDYKSTTIFLRADNRVTDSLI